jgi:hypothetical protein
MADRLSRIHDARNLSAPFSVLPLANQLEDSVLIVTFAHAGAAQVAFDFFLFKPGLYIVPSLYGAIKALTWISALRGRHGVDLTERHRKECQTQTLSCGAPHRYRIADMADPHRRYFSVSQSRETD